VASFVSQHSVWFSFVAPPSGHVSIEGISDTLRKPIGVQIALYRSFNGSCNGFYSHVRSQYTDTSLNERMEVSCLFPGQRYFILIDGSGDAARGLFTLSVSDAGDITPFTYQDTTLCYGQQLQVANSIYTESGTYNDTIPLTGSCYRVIVTELTILDSISLSIQQTRLAYSEGTANAQAVATATGGSGSGYTFSWCNGETAATAEQLTGGSLCCVTVTDSLGCSGSACFEVEYARPILPDFQGDSLSCAGDRDGRIVFSASSGYPPYNYSWQHSSLPLNGSGSMLPAQAVTIEQLPAGDYTVTISDILFDTTFTVSIWQPGTLAFAGISVTNASCFGFCDGAASVTAIGGSPPYQYSWSDPGGQDNTLSNACAGSYAVQLSDANGCLTDTSLLIGQPPQFIAVIQVSRPVSCFEGRDGQLTVTSNGQPVLWRWSQGATTAVGDSLATGNYSVTVTNADGCEATASAFLPQPGSPLTVELGIRRVISCHEATDGQLAFQAAGPYQSLSSLWSTGSRLSVLTSLGAGTYSLTITSEKGCTATDSIQLDQPQPLTAAIDTGQINCLTGPYGGSLSVASASGGKPPYLYALDEQPFVPTARWEGLPAGSYTIRLLDTADCMLSLPVLITEPPELIVSLGDDEEIRLGDSIELSVQANSSQLLFNWPHLPGFTGDRLYVRPLETQVFRVIARDTITFCEEEAYVRLTVDRNPRVYMPTAFSPNSDGVNDSYYPLTDNAVVQIRSLRIFSRGGQLVYEGRNFAPNDPLPGWDGSFRGQPMPVGMYAYLAEIVFLDGRTEFFKGELTLLR
jgi:gliding motility-associated-like protein